MPPRKKPASDDTPVNELWNLSDITAGWLKDEGINTYGDLQKHNLVELWWNLKQKNSQVTKLMYYALWGAVNNLHWNYIPDSEKEALIAFIASKE